MVWVCFVRAVCIFCCLVREKLRNKTYKNKQECKIFIIKKNVRQNCIYVQDDELILMLILG